MATRIADLSPIATREAGPFDVPVIAALHVACFADGLGGSVWSEAAIAKVLALPGAYGVLALAGLAPSPLGFVLGRAAADESEILSLGVPPAHRRQGVGRALVRAALAQARRDGAGRLYLEAAEDNAAAQALYGAEGFAVVGRRPAYYQRQDRPVDALVYACSIE